jgi:adenylate cyclase
VHGRLEFVFDELGPLNLKNVARPVEAFVARIPEPISGHVAESAALSLPEKPSIAVLPFQNMSGDPKQEYSAGGMVGEEIITAVAHPLGGHC